MTTITTTEEIQQQRSSSPYASFLYTNNFINNEILMDEYKSMNMLDMGINKNSGSTTTVSNGIKSYSDVTNAIDETIRRLHRSSLTQLSTTTTKVKFVGEDDDLSICTDRNGNNSCNAATASGVGSSAIISYCYPSYVTTVHEIFRRQDLPKDVAREYWYSKQEIKQISKRNKSLAASVSSPGNYVPRRHSLDETITNTTAILDNKSCAIPSSSYHQGGLTDRRRKKRVKKTENLVTTRPSTSTSKESAPIVSNVSNCTAHCVDSKNNDTYNISNSNSTCCNTTLIEQEEEEMAYRLYNDTCRGLETLINLFHRRLVKEQRHHTKQTVLNEQTRQYQKCEISPKFLAKKAKDTSESAVLRAYIQGQLDAQDVYGSTFILNNDEVKPTIGTTPTRQSKDHDGLLAPCTSCLSSFQSSTCSTSSKTEISEDESLQKQQHQVHQDLKGQNKSRSITTNLRSLFNKKTLASTSSTGTTTSCNVNYEASISIPPTPQRRTSMYGLSA